MSDNVKKASALVGLSVLGSCIAGVLSLIVAVLSFFDGDFAVTGICLAAAGASFGLLANAVLRG